jgi:hypothetical protein
MRPWAFREITIDAALSPFDKLRVRIKRSPHAELVEA